MPKMRWPGGRRGAKGRCGLRDEERGRERRKKEAAEQRADRQTAGTGAGSAKRLAGRPRASQGGTFFWLLDGVAAALSAQVSQARNKNKITQLSYLLNFLVVPIFCIFYTRTQSPQKAAAKRRHPSAVRLLLARSSPSRSASSDTGGAAFQCATRL